MPDFPTPPAPVPAREIAFARESPAFTWSVPPERTVVVPVPSTLLLPETWSVPVSTPIAPLYPLLLPLRASVPPLSLVRLPVPLSAVVGSGLREAVERDHREGAPGMGQLPGWTRPATALQSGFRAGAFQDRPEIGRA